MSECHYMPNYDELANGRCPECQHALLIHDDTREGGLPTGVGCIICDYKTNVRTAVDDASGFLPSGLAAAIRRSDEPDAALAEHDHLGDPNG